MTKQEKKCEYEKLNNYCKDGKLTFDPTEQPTIAEFTDRIGEPMHLVARCVLNTPENFPEKYNKDGTRSKRQREYFIDDPTYTGKKIDYIGVDKAKWTDTYNEWLYCLAYDNHIVKIGMTITSLKERWCGSYSCGVSRAMTKGSCSTTNFIISECNFAAVHCGMNVEIYGICCPKKKETVARFGVKNTIPSSTVRGCETLLSKCFKTTYEHKPVFNIQEGTTAVQTQDIVVYREVTNNKTKKVKKNVEGEEKKKRAPTAYNIFVKEKMAVVKEEFPELNRQDLMKKIAVMWSAEKVKQ